MIVIDSINSSFTVCNSFNDSPPEPQLDFGFKLSIICETTSLLTGIKLNSIAVGCFK